MSQAKDLLQIIGFFGGGFNDTPKVYFLPMDQVSDVLMRELLDAQGQQWRDVYRVICECGQWKCDECQDVEDAKLNGHWCKEDQDSRDAWILFHKIVVLIEPNTPIPGRVVKYLLYHL